MKKIILIIWLFCFLFASSAFAETQMNKIVIKDTEILEWIIHEYGSIDRFNYVISSSNQVKIEKIQSELSALKSDGGGDGFLLLLCLLLGIPIVAVIII